MRYRYEGKEIYLDASSVGKDYFRIRTENLESVFPKPAITNLDSILPGPVRRGKDYSGNIFHILSKDDRVFVHWKGQTFSFRRIEKGLEQEGEISREVRSPMPGKILKICKNSGENFEKGEVLLVLEAMKMENQIKAGFSGWVDSLTVKEGDLVSQDALLMTLAEPGNKKIF